MNDELDLPLPRYPPFSQHPPPADPPTQMTPNGRTGPDHPFRLLGEGGRGQFDPEIWWAQTASFLGGRLGAGVRQVFGTVFVQVFGAGLHPHEQLMRTLARTVGSVVSAVFRSSGHQSHAESVQRDPQFTKLLGAPRTGRWAGIEPALLILGSRRRESNPRPEDPGGKGFKSPTQGRHALRLVA